MPVTRDGNCSGWHGRTVGLNAAGADVTRDTEAVAQRAAGGGAVLSMALCVMVLIASEFMPVSLLTPIASDL